MTLKSYDDLLRWTINVGQTRAASLDIMYEPFIYAANYKHTFERHRDHIFVTMRWIYYGFPRRLFWNRFNLTIDSASLVHKIYKRHIYVIGNSLTLPKQLEHHPIPKDAFIIRFNKSIIHENKTDVCIFNDMLFEMLDGTIRSTSISCVNVARLNTDDRFDYNKKGDELFTTGLLTIMWLTTLYTMYDSLTILGFDMVNPGEKAHYFDHETPAKPCVGFAGHDAANEKNVLSAIELNKAFKTTWIKI
jgi:hypothetical protein